MEQLSDDDPDKKLFTRFHFLHFDVQSIQTTGNKELFAKLNPDFHAPDESENMESIESEKWSDWKNFPKLEEYREYESLTEGPGLDLIAWLVHTFSTRVYFCRLRGKRNKERRKEEQAKAGDCSLDTLTLDDLTFIFCQVEHNINKWNLFFRAFKTQYIDFWKGADDIEYCEIPAKKKKKKQSKAATLIGDDGDQMSKKDRKKIDDMDKRGYEFRSGSGFDKGEGQTRYRQIKKYLYRAYYKRDPEVIEKVRANRKALDDAVKILADKKSQRERARAGVSMDDSTAADQPEETSMPELSVDEELDEINAMVLENGVGVWEI